MAGEKSRPARGAWVEISACALGRSHRGRRAPQGARGLKFQEYRRIHQGLGRRAPQGARGLK